MRKLDLLLPIVSGILGTILGGYLFSRSQPRSVLALNRCDQCWSLKDLKGLIGSVAMQKFPGIIPSVTFETDRTIVMKHPFLEAAVHYVIVPKKDIKNIGEISEEDAPYIMDALLVAKKIVDEERLVNYRLYTNGPGLQAVTYLHFHLKEDR